MEEKEEPNMVDTIVTTTIDNNREGGRRK